MGISGSFSLRSSGHPIDHHHHPPPRRIPGRMKMLGPKAGQPIPTLHNNHPGRRVRQDPAPASAPRRPRPDRGHHPENVPRRQSPTHTHTRVSVNTSLPPKEGVQIATLSARELDVLAQVALGCTNAEAAKRLSLKPETVKSYLRSATAKLGAHTRHEAVAKARRARLLP